MHLLKLGSPGWDRTTDQTIKETVLARRPSVSVVCSTAELLGNTCHGWLVKCGADSNCTRHTHSKPFAGGHPLPGPSAEVTCSFRGEPIQFLVRPEGLEPPRPYGQQDLNLSRLPISPRAQCFSQTPTNDAVGDAALDHCGAVESNHLGCFFHKCDNQLSGRLDSVEST